MFNSELNKTAISMGKVIYLLSELESKIKTPNQIFDYKDDFLVIAYLCRVGILDRIMTNNWQQFLPITIPMGLIKVRKETIATGLMLTVGKLKEIVEPDPLLTDWIEDTLNKGTCFYKLDEMIPEEEKKQF